MYSTNLMFDTETSEKLNLVLLLKIIFKIFKENTQYSREYHQHKNLFPQKSLLHLKRNKHAMAEGQVQFQTVETHL